MSDDEQPITMADLRKLQTSIGFRELLDARLVYRCLVWAIEIIEDQQFRLDAVKQALEAEGPSR